LRNELIVEKDFEREVANASGRERYARGNNERTAYRNFNRTHEINTVGRPGNIPRRRFAR
jgi:hypothetical protein